MILTHQIYDLFCVESDKCRTQWVEGIIHHSSKRLVHSFAVNNRYTLIHCFSGQNEWQSFKLCTKGYFTQRLRLFYRLSLALDTEHYQSVDGSKELYIL